MCHLSEFQIQELLSGDCGVFAAWMRRRHLKKCTECSKKADCLKRELDEQCRLGKELKAYQKYSNEASATMRLPRE
ncbi:MAG: hypothetical protein MJ106_04360 [Lentisphaeria bacterium]|nr:hypothetical protein [Lentisphaeria bacterium]